jgi:hypothetical protein
MPLRPPLHRNRERVLFYPRRLKVPLEGAEEIRETKEDLR